MKTLSIKSVGHYVEKVISDEGIRRMFRGHESEQYDLIPVIGRMQKYNGMPLKDVTVKERNLIKQFRRDGAHLLATGLTDWEILFTARHHGLPTRLLDWSKNPMVALYFAIESGSEETAVVFSEKLNTPLDLRKNTDPLQIKRVARINPPHLTDRIRAQSSTFTIHPDPRVPYLSSNLIRYTIDQKHKKEMKSQIRKLGFHEASLFGGLDAIARMIF